MDYRAIEIDEMENKEDRGKVTDRAKNILKAMPNGASSSRTGDAGKDQSDRKYEDLSAASETTMWSSKGEDVEALEATESWRFRRDACFEHSFRSWQQEDHRGGEAHLGSEAALEHSLMLIERRLEEYKRAAGRSGEGRNSSISIFRLPNSLVGINPKAQQPEVVSIGPLHRGEDHLLKFEEHKWFFLDKLLSRTIHFGRNLSTYIGVIKELEDRARECYSDIVLISSHDFIEMLLLDGCFVVELLRHLGKSYNVIDEDDPIFTRPWLIPILIRDLLKLENQLPIFVLDSLFRWSNTDTDDPDEKANDFSLLALKVIDLAFPRPLEFLDRCRDLKGKHLLHLFYQSLIPQNRRVSDYQDTTSSKYCPSSQSIQCVTQLRPSGIKFKQRQSNSFLDINFQNSTLEIPAITINDFTSTILINCIAFEQCEEDGQNYFTGYAAFMNCLINEPQDVACLCCDGIITRFSRDDQYVNDLFKQLGKGITINMRDCFLCKQFRDVEAYYSSHWAVMMRTYFSSPWSFISVFSAFILIMLTLLQTLMAIISYQRQFG